MALKVFSKPDLTVHIYGLIILVLIMSEEYIYAG